MAIKHGYILINPHLRSGSVRKRLLAVMSDKETMREVHKKLKEFVEPFVPMDTGNLRDHAKVLPSGVVYETPYAHYQYMGIVYEPNIKIWSYDKGSKSSSIVAWRSVKGTKKTPSERELGVPGEWMGWRFGYSEPDTTHHWMEEAFKSGGKARFSKQATRVMKARARRLNKKW